jgi:hypothetical protein
MPHSSRIKTRSISCVPKKPGLLLAAVEKLTLIENLCQGGNWWVDPRLYLFSSTQGYASALVKREIFIWMDMLCVGEAGKIIWISWKWD